ncbi:MAG: hypothetical protein HY820_10870 [Acidobacteria bacterium]|nr:hypothetical protein [Acidobacteriota bacterium]
MSRPLPKVQVLVEGTDDAYLVKHSVKASTGWDLPMTHFVPGSGASDLLTKAAAIKDATGYDCVAIVCDADSNPQQRWQELRDRIGATFLPNHPDPAGTIVPFVRNTRLGVWMMPDNLNPGALENFLAAIRSGAVPQPALWNKAGQSVASLSMQERLFAPQDTLKAHLRTWLAWQKEPGAPYGLAVSLSSFDTAHPLASAFSDWFRRLCS